MKILIVGNALPGNQVDCGKIVVNVTNISKEPYALPQSGLVVLECDNFQVIDNGDGTQSFAVNVMNSGLISAEGAMGIPSGKVSVFMPAGVSRDFQMVPSGTLHNGSIAVSQGYGDRATTVFLDSILFRMPSPLVKGDQILVEGTFEFEDFQHQGRDRRKVKLVMNSYQRQKGKRPNEGGAPAAGNGGHTPPPSNKPAGNNGGGFSRPAAPAAGNGTPAGNNGGGFSRPAAPAAGNGTPAGNNGGGFSKPSGGNEAPKTGGFGRPPESNLPEIDINEDEIPF